MPVRTTKPKPLASFALLVVKKTVKTRSGAETVDKTTRALRVFRETPTVSESSYTNKRCYFVPNKPRVEGANLSLSESRKQSGLERLD